MTVGELIEKLKEFDPNLDVGFSDGEYGWTLIHVAEYVPVAEGYGVHHYGPDPFPAVELS